MREVFDVGLVKAEECEKFVVANGAAAFGFGRVVGWLGGVEGVVRRGVVACPKGKRGSKKCFVKLRVLDGWGGAVDIVSGPAVPGLSVGAVFDEPGDAWAVGRRCGGACRDSDHPGNQ